MINRGTFSSTDLIQGYSTLFAVSIPGTPASVDKRPVTTADILKALHHNRFRSVEGLQRGDGRVFLEGPQWSVGETAPLPGAWARTN